MQDYERLKSQFKDIGYLNRAIALLDWDHETYLPSKGIHFRADQQAFLSGLAHERIISTDIADLIASCEANQDALNAFQQANVRAWRKDHDRSTKLPTAFVEKFEKTCALGKASWAEAREKSRFNLFESHLESLIELSRQKADFFGYDKDPYDALMDIYEPGCNTDTLTPLFAELKASIVEWLPNAVEQTGRIEDDFLKDNYPIEGQQALNEAVARALGFDFESGRIDATTHPFCTELGPNDIRLTTRYDVTDFTVSLYSVLHEAGHGLYEQGFKHEHDGTPMAEAVSLGIHESQSRLWENKIGRAPEFWSYWYDQACGFLPALKRFSPDDLTLAVNRVKPSLIRVEADEVTYDLHIILRYEIEKALIAGELKVKDVPHVWNEQFEAMFGLKVPDDAHGCLQDIHWSMGGFGYFPTYTLGNLNSAQLFHAARRALSEHEASFQQGEYRPLLEWLQTKVHEHGRMHEPSELMRLATGQSTQTHFHGNYLKERFLSIGT